MKYFIGEIFISGELFPYKSQDIVVSCPIERRDESAHPVRFSECFKNWMHMNYVYF